MTGGKVFDAALSRRRRTSIAFSLSAKCCVDDHDQRIVLAHDPGVFLAKLELYLLAYFPSGVGPEDILDLALYDSEGPADGVVEAEFPEPSGVGFGRATRYFWPILPVSVARFTKK